MNWFGDKILTPRCIDGDVGPDKRGKKFSFCHTKKEPHPWLAIDYGKRVNVERVDIFNRRGKWGKRTEKVEVRISDQLPTSSKEKFSGGTLLGTFEGTGGNPQHIVVSGEEETNKKNEMFFILLLFTICLLEC